MEVGGRDVVELDLPDDAYAERGQARAVRAQVGGLQDHHVAAVASALVEQAAGGGALAHGRDHLEEGLPHRHDGVVQAELGHARVAEPDLDAEHGGQVGDHRLELPRHQRDLADVHGAQRPWKRGSRFSRKAATPSRWSAVWPQRRCVTASRSSTVRKSAVSDRFTFSFM